ncbi:ATP-binding protein [Spongiivirga sp. MCCC 1A20706]
MITKRLSLRSRIFITMIFLVVIASVLIAAVTIYQYQEQAKDYNKQRSERKVEQLQKNIKYVIKNTTWERTSERLGLIFKDKIHQIADVHSVHFNIYDIEGNLVQSSRASITDYTAEKKIDNDIIEELARSADKKAVRKKTTAAGDVRNSYTYITDLKFKPIGILNLPYYEDDSFSNMELIEFLKRLAFAYLLMLVTAIALAFIISKYITKSLKTISDKINQTALDKRNEKITLKNPSEELFGLINAYNSMVDELEESAVKLATSEREQAWREMAKQVAHEIKNPLTPMRLSVQSFQRKFDPEDPNINKKVDEYSKTLIQQIDTMSSIASAFSNFAQMPAQQKETLNVVKIVKLALDIFNENYIYFSTSEKEVIAKLDRTQLIRVVTNLVKNAIQAMKEVEKPEILVGVTQNNGDVIIKVQDNGNGISDENKSKIFEPKFTTKTSGMGLGLPMIKNIIETYKGSISFESEEGKGTTFTVTFPKE